MKLFSNKLYIFFIVIFFSGCAVYGALGLKQKYGPAAPKDRQVSAAASAPQVDYWKQVKPILDNRCVVCHGCYEAPCQLKLTAMEGIDRGASKNKVYAHERLVAAPTSRLFEDHHTTTAWRNNGFFPVLNEREDSVDANLNASLLFNSLQLKQAHPQPKTKILPKAMPVGINRENSCPKIEEYPEFAAEHPNWGMPYALPGLNEKELATLTTWLAEGAQYTRRQPLSTEMLSKVAHWEGFLNGDSKKARLMSRYIYEHLFLGHIYFAEHNNGTFFRLVRSKTPPGQPVDMIATRRPFDDPQVNRVYYRLVEFKETVVLKTHMPYLLDQKRMDRWTSLFLNDTYTVSKLPGYNQSVAGNPFKSFSQLPVDSRYKFMLDEAHFTIKNYIKGPVCRGSVSLNVIRDQFWVFFVDPDSALNQEVSKSMAMLEDQLALPNDDDVYTPLFQWLNYSAKQKQLKNKREKYLLDLFKTKPLDLNVIWDGDGSNQNAALTIMRHHDGASVEKGLLGGEPNTLWLVDYSLLERIHYLLVANYDVYGNLGHHLLSRLHMDFLRMEGENAFLMLLPQAERKELRQFWYRGAEEHAGEYMTNPDFDKQVVPNIDYQTDNPKKELLAQIRIRLQPVIDQSKTLQPIQNAQFKTTLTEIANFKGKHTQYLPDIALVEVKMPPSKGKSSSGKDQIFTMVKNVGYTNIASLFNEQARIVPQENSLVLVNGVTSPYVNAIFEVEYAAIDQFKNQLLGMQSEQDYVKLIDAFGIRRTNPRFWQVSDSIHQALYNQPINDYGLLDYGRLENR